MASDPPQLDLNDILVNIDGNLNPPPTNGVPNALASAPAGTGRVVSRSMSPEPPDEQDLLAMRLRALSIRDSKGKGKEDPAGNELIDMVLRLTAAIPARAQILEQATVIRRMSVQQDFIFKRIDDERARWQAEKDCMQRVCEALILQANVASHNGYKDQKTTLIEADNIILKQKLSDTQSKVSALEAELAQLRPLLLMQPSAIAASKGLSLNPGKSGKKDEDSAAENAESRSYYRVREDRAASTSSPKAKKKKASAYFKHAPAVADARSEHLLLAMRKLGRERATMLSQSMYQTTDPPPSVAPNQNLTAQMKNNVNLPRPMMSPAVWPAHVQHSPSAGQQTGQQPKSPQPGTSSPSKGQQNPPFSPYGHPAGAHYQHYLVPSSSVPRPPGAPMPAPGFYHTGPPRGYIPGPAWPYYSPGPYTFSQPIPVQNHSQGANGSQTHPQSTTSPPVAGPSHSPAHPPSQSSSTPASIPRTTASGQSISQKMKSPRQGQQPRGPRTPQSKSAATPVSGGTPMDNLLSAAQSVFSPSVPPVMSGSRTSDDLGSPLPRKRRRVDRQDGQTKSKGKQLAAPEPVADTDRPSSALDVLADQAAGVNLSTRASERGSRRNGDPGDVFTVENVRRTSSVRKGKRPMRASSTTPASTIASPSLIPPISTQRAASEDRASLVSVTSQISTESFKLRPVQDDTFSVKNRIIASSGRSASVPRSAGAPSKRGGSAANRGKQANGRALTPQSRVSTRQPRTVPSQEPGADGNGAEVESEDEPDVDTEVDQLDDDDASSKGINVPARKRIDVGAADIGEDVNSRRWLEILGRKES